MDVVVNRLNNGQGAIGFHHGDIGFHVVSPASGIPEPRSLYPVVPKTYDRFGLATGPKSEKLTGPFGNEVATKCILVRVDRRLSTPLFRQVYQRFRNAV